MSLLGKFIENSTDKQFMKLQASTLSFRRYHPKVSPYKYITNMTVFVIAST